ncbi:F-box protein At2g26160-like [Trifolium pratense]|uniref:F-box protein At2g26160-like n=1 Tax=Trifolium pratense TaxID=57577 RepID=UPI001E690CF1|nr:F-box protein At2g26160-like [Trifolium pratense]
MMNMNKKECSQLYLPEELWAIIFKKLKSPLDVVRFRSTCSLWHSFLPPPTLSFNLCIPHQEYFLEQTKIYRIQPSPHDQDPSTSPCSNNKGWLIKVFQNTDSSKFYLFNLFTNQRLSSLKVNLMNVRVVELFELYTLCQRYKNNFGFAPDSIFHIVILFSVEGRCMVFALYTDKKLRVSNIGEQKFTILKKDDYGGKRYFDFDDIILYKGQVYVVDEIGTIFWINTLSLKLVQFSPKNSSCGEERQPMNFDKRLVEYDGNLYVVDLYIDGDDEKYRRLSYLSRGVYVKVYKFDQEWGKWLDVKDLCDVSFVLGKDSNFALLAQDYHGCERNCIYFYYQCRASCFSLENLEFKLAKSFWPCPTLFYSMTC